VGRPLVGEPIGKIFFWVPSAPRKLWAFVPLHWEWIMGKPPDGWRCWLRIKLRRPHDASQEEDEYPPKGACWACPSWGFQPRRQWLQAAGEESPWLLIYKKPEGLPYALCEENVSRICQTLGVERFLTSTFAATSRGDWFSTQLRRSESGLCQSSG